jgi:lipopolysaccharide transport system ATP-binding protein
MSSETAIRVVDLEKRYRVWAHARPTNVKERLHLLGATLRARAGLGTDQGLRREVHALRGVSFDVGRGEVLGVIGRNGAGKSTLLSILARITEPTGGRAELYGRVSSLLEVGTGFHPELSGRDNVRLNGAILGMSRAETARKFDEIVEFSGVRDFIDIPVKRYSSGMQVRLAFAVAAHLDPEILLLDEVLAVGDTEFQARCHARVQEITKSGRTVLFVSHDVNSVARLCNRTVLLQDGLVGYIGSTKDAIEHYLGSRPVLLGGGDLAQADHTGSGEMRFLDIAFSGRSGRSQIESEGPLEIAVGVQPPSSESIANVTIRLELVSTSGVALATLATTVDTTALRGLAHEGRAALKCRVDELPLRQGNYFVTIRAIAGTELLDQVADQVEITVTAPGDEPQPTSDLQHAPVIVRQHWDVGAPVAASSIAS